MILKKKNSDRQWETNNRRCKMFSLGTLEKQLILCQYNWRVWKDISFSSFMPFVAVSIVFRYIVEPDLVEF